MACYLLTTGFFAADFGGTFFSSSKDYYFDMNALAKLFFLSLIEVGALILLRGDGFWFLVTSK